MELPQLAQEPQSSTQLPQFSPPSQVPLPQSPHTPQSTVQLAQLSPASQEPSPQPSQRPQSEKQELQSSLAGSQIPLPQLVVAPSASTPRTPDLPHPLPAANPANPRISRLARTTAFEEREGRDMMDPSRTILSLGPRIQARFVRK